MSHIIAVANQKGGVGKTTTTINLGAALAELGRYTLLADLDPQGGLSLGLGLAAHDLDLTIYNVLTDARIPVAGVVHHIRPHLDLLPSNIDLAVAEVQLVSAMGREYILRDALSAVREQYEYILLDCPPSLGLLTVNALTAADVVLVPLQVEFFALRGVESLMDIIARVQRRLNPRLEIIGLLPTMVDPRRLHDQRVINEVKATYPGKVLDIIIKESIKFAEAPARQRSILELDTRHEGAQAYRALARAVLRYYNELPPEPPPLPEPPRDMVPTAALDVATDAPDSSEALSMDPSNGTGAQQISTEPETLTVFTGELPVFDSNEFSSDTPVNENAAASSAESSASDVSSENDAVEDAVVVTTDSRLEEYIPLGDVPSMGDTFVASDGGTVDLDSTTVSDSINPD